MDMDVDPVPDGSSTGIGGDSSFAAAASSVAATDSSPAIKTPSSRLLQFSESLKLEHQFLRVSLEHLKRAMRTNHRVAGKEVSAIISDIAVAVDRPDPMSTDDAVSHLTSLVSRIQGLKRKLEEGGKVEHQQAQRCRARLDHLDSVEGDNFSEWNDIRLKRILVDYMLRASYYETAVKIAEGSNMLDLVDIDIFLDVRKVIESLQNKEVAPALAWCAENKSRLKKSKSKLEFQLRLQEYIELVRADEYLRAITFARRYLSPLGATNIKELQRVLTTVVFRKNTECATYKVLFDSSQWDMLVEKFKREFCRIFGMTDEPLLNIFLQAGLSALKTPSCYEKGCTKEDPLSQEDFRKLAEPLPFSKQDHSKLVCYITKELMDHENPPLVLPNGYVYGTKALEEMAKNNEGKITCPRTGDVCSYSELAKAFI